MLISFVRHGESVDNLKPVWAGWKDAPLSNHGLRQAQALGEHWKDVPVTAVYCSDLKRAHTTAQQLVSQKVGTELEIQPVVNPLWREQNFGIAEGKKWAAQHAGNDEEVYVTIYNRHDKFEDGESLDDLAARMDQAIDEIVWPHVIEAINTGHTDSHIVVVSHGLAISEAVAALLRRNPAPSSTTRSYKGLMNTAWSQVQIDISEGKVTNIHVVSTNNCPHLSGLKRQAGGIGSTAHDENQRSIKEFFGGGGGSTAVAHTESSTTDTSGVIALATDSAVSGDKPATSSSS